MPLYEYQCPQCGRFERIQKFSDEPLSACPTCGRAVQKLLSAPAFQFKGSGWYVTDYARKSGDGATSDAAKSGAGTAKTGDKGAGGGASDTAAGSKASDSSSAASTPTAGK